MMTTTIEIPVIMMKMIKWSHYLRLGLLDHFPAAVHQQSRLGQVLTHDASTVMNDGDKAEINRHTQRCLNIAILMTTSPTNQQLLAPVVKALDLVAEKSCGSQGKS